MMKTRLSPLCGVACMVGLIGVVPAQQRSKVQRAHPADRTRVERVPGMAGEPRPGKPALFPYEFRTIDDLANEVRDLKARPRQLPNQRELFSG